MKLQEILENLAHEVSKISYQGNDKTVARVTLPKKVVQALSDDLYAKERNGSVRSVDIKSIHFSDGVVEIDTL